MEKRQIKPLPLDVGYILGLSGPSQGGTTWTDHVADVTFKDTLCGAIAEATKIRVTVSELTYQGGNKYVVTLEMDVKPLGNCRTPDTPLHIFVATTTITVEIRNVNRGWIIDAATWPFQINCDTGPFHFSPFRDVPAAGWLQDWASTTLRVDGAWEPCG